MVKSLVSLILIFLGCYFIYDNNMFNIKQTIRDYKQEVVVPKDTSNKKDIVISYVQNTNNFIPRDKQDILNIYYTVLNSGWNEFTFYCARSYTNCINQVKIISDDKDMLSHLNSFVEPFNIYNNIFTTYYETGKVTLRVNRLYTNKAISKINTEVDKLYKELVNPVDTPRNNILKIHDYVVNNVKYDIKKSDNLEDNTYQSTTAYGPLFEGYAVCSGYADLMALFLDKMNIPNIKVATDKHVWNLVYIENKWYHLDLTWDDPITETGEQILSHTFFLVDSKIMKKYDVDVNVHQYDPAIYSEAQ